MDETSTLRTAKNLSQRRGGAALSEPEPSILRHYLGIVWRFKWLLISPAVVLPLLVFVLARSQATVYETAAGVLLNHQDLAAASISGVQAPPEDAGRYAIDQAIVARSPVLVHRVLAAAGEPNAPTTTLLNHSGVAANTDVLEFYVRQSTPEAATRVANIYAREYTTFRRELDKQELSGTLSALSTRIQRLRQGGAGTAALANTLAARQEQLQLLQALRSSNVYVVNRATLADATEKGPRPLHSAIFAFIGGLVLGLLLIAFVNALDDRVFAAGELSAALGAPLLARIARAGTDPDETVRVASLLALAIPENGTRSVLLLPLGAQADPRLIVGLAEGLARLRGRVVLVDADLRTRAITGALGLESHPGFADLVRGGHGAHHETERGFTAVPAGTVDGPVAALLAERSTAAVVERLGQGADLVVVAGPSSGAGETPALAAAVDSVIVLAESGVPGRVLNEARQALASSGSRVLGFVLSAQASTRGGSSRPTPRRTEARREVSRPAVSSDA